MILLYIAPIVAGDYIGLYEKPKSAYTPYRGTII